MAIKDLFGKELKVVNIGIRSFAEDLEKQGRKVVHLDWKPAAGGDERLQSILETHEKKRLKRVRAMKAIRNANDEVVERLKSAEPRLVDIKTLGEVVPEADAHTLFHAGPPVTWEHMSGPMKGAVYAALIYEGVAATPEEAERIAARGEITFRPCHEAGMVGPMTGITSVSMPLYEIRNEKYGNTAYSTINEGMGNVIRFRCLRRGDDRTASVDREGLRTGAETAGAAGRGRHRSRFLYRQGASNGR